MNSSSSEPETQVTPAWTLLSLSSPRLAGREERTEEHVLKNVKEVSLSFLSLSGFVPRCGVWSVVSALWAMCCFTVRTS